MKDNWSKFEWVRNGENGGNREGYGPDLFQNFSEDERERAERLLIEDYYNGDVFAASGLAMLLGEKAELFFKKELIREDISLVEKIHLSALLSYASKDFSHSEYLLNYLDNENIKIKSMAIKNLDMIRNIIPNSAIGKLLGSLRKETDRDQRYKLGRLISDISKDESLKKLAIDCKFSETESERVSTLKNYGLF